MAKHLNLFIPQWQDSGLTQELYEGAYALRDYIESKNIIFSEIPISLSLDTTIENGIIGYNTIVKQLNMISKLLEETKPDQLFSIGGGCGIEIPLVSYLYKKYKGMDVIWFDAHGDLNTPDSSPSQYFHGMPLRFLLDNIPGNEISKKYNKINIDDVLLVGIRDLDDPEEEYIQINKIKMIKVNHSEIKNGLEIKKLLNKKNNNAYLHIDLDVLDPEIYKNVKCPTENGYTVEEIIKIINIIKSEKTIVGVSLLENIEKKDEEISKINELIDIGINL
ncbi:arginase family protein [bacterium]